MGLGPLWQTPFIPPAPPVDADEELLRYILQLHDQITITFLDAQRILNQTIIGGDGDGGPGPSDTTETDGGSIIYDGSSLSLSSDGTQPIQQYWHIAASVFQSGWRMATNTGNITDADQFRFYRIPATRDWDRVTIYAMNLTNNDYTMDLDIDYASIADGEDWDPALTASAENSVTVDFSNDATANVVNVATFTIAAVTGEMLFLQLTHGNYSLTGDRGWRMPAFKLHFA